MGDRSTRHVRNPILASTTIIDQSETNIIYGIRATYEKVQSVPVEQLGRPAANAPTTVDIGNLTLLRFTVDTDLVTLKFPVPNDYDSGPLEFRIIWTNDGGDDNYNENVRWRMDYTISAEGEPIDGAGVATNVDDTYTTPVGWVEHRTGFMNIPETAFTKGAGQCAFIKLMAVTPPATELSCEPHLIGICHKYDAITVQFE